MTVRSLLARSVIAAAAAILLAVVVVGLGVDVLASRQLHRDLDSTLHQRAVEVSQLSASAPALLTAPGALDSPLGGTQLSVEVVDRHRRIVARSLALGGRVLPGGALVTDAIDAGRDRYATATFGGEHVRLYAAPLADFGGQAAGGAVVVAASESELEHTLANLHFTIIVAGLAAAALAAAAVALLLRRALRPVGLLATAAAEVERTGDARRRLPAPESDDEVGRLARTLNAMLASLERSRLAERRFLADASHELRTPLTALRGNVAYLRKHGATPEVLDALDDDAERLARLAEDLLALSREEAATVPQTAVRLDRLAHEAARGDPAVDVHAPAPVEVHGDEAALERALANLIENARTHGPRNGTITVTAATDDGVARLSVADEGPGLRVEEHELAFKRFWRRSGDRPGSGLGLAIVRATAERHGGRAYAEGSRFTIELPVLRDLSGPRATTRSEEP